jgi:hypothetical protein
LQKAFLMKRCKTVFQRFLLESQEGSTADLDAFREAARARHPAAQGCEDGERQVLSGNRLMRAIGIRRPERERTFTRTKQGEGGEAKRR